jgi:signal transduction histidine kinase
MNDSWAAVVELIGVQLALVSAAIHLWWGLPRLFVYLSAGSFADPRPYLFVISAVAIVVGSVALFLGGPPRVLYVLGIGAMLTYALGYAAWHLTGHGGFLSFVTGYGHDIENPLATVLGHLAADLLALAAMVVELGAIACFALLLYHETTRRTATSAGTAEI